MGTVRGDEESLLADEDWLSDDDAQTPDDRSPLDEWQENIRTFAVGKAKKDPHFRPYAHPFYWAGFQVTGW